MTDSPKPTIHLLGYGKVGGLLQRSFANAGYPVKLLAREGALAIESGVIVIAVQDGKLPDVVKRFHEEGGFGAGVVVCHTAGGYSAEVLAPLRSNGCQVMAWHPLQTFVGGETPEVLHGVTFGIDGDEDAVTVGEQMARDLGGIPRRIDPELRMRYHLAAVMACANLTGLAEMSADVSGLDKQEALPALTPLMQRTINNIDVLGMPDAISGPIRRGDVETIKAHLAILKDFPQAESVYRATSLKLLDLLQGEMGADVYDELRQLLVIPDWVKRRVKKRK